MKIKAVILSTLIAICGVGVAGVAIAGDDYLEQQAQQRAKISYEQAQTLAMRAVGGGVAVDVDFELGLNAGYYDVDVLFNNLSYEVKIDATTGNVISKKLDD